MNYDATQIILALSPWIGILTSLGLSIWRLSALNSQVMENTKDVNGVGEKVREVELEVRTNSKDYDKKFNELMNEFTASVNNLSNTVIRLETKFDVLIDQNKN